MSPASPEDRSGPQPGPLPHLPSLDGAAPNGSLVIFPALVERLSEALGADLRSLTRDELHDRLTRLASLRRAADADEPAPCRVCAARG